MKAPREPRPGPDLEAYGTRLTWGPAGGIARHGGVQIALTECPQPLAGRRVVALDYAPGLGLASASDVVGTPVAMTAVERTAVRAWLLQALSVQA